MTDTERYTEIGTRLDKLKEVRQELTIERSAYDDACKRLSWAGQHARDIGKTAGRQPDEWPTLEELRGMVGRITYLEEQEKKLLSELKGLGAEV